MPDTAMTPDIADVLDRLDAGREDALGRLFELLAIPSVSTDPAHEADCRQAAGWLVQDLAAMGFEAGVEETGGHPAVVATDHASDGPHVLFYGHYDVQPPDPLELWETPPFEPQLITREDGSQVIRARGAGDDKGQLMTFLEACRAFRAARGALPCKVTILLEGEEEIGSRNLPAFLEANAERFRADVALVCDTTMWDRETPAITTMLRGLAGEEVTVKAANRDLHSGFYGGAAANPITLLARALGEMHGPDGHVRIPGFYDGVPEMPPEVREQWKALPFDAGDFLGEVGLSVPAGERERSCLEMTWSRPTAEVNGIQGGYTGPGFKTVIPAEASAKVSFRLVGDQDPERVRAAFRAFVEARMPADVTVEFTAHGSGRAIAMDIDRPVFETARVALGQEWGREAFFIGCGGGIPVVGTFKRALGMDSLLVGFGLADDGIHSPNEKYERTSFEKGARSWARILAAMAGRG